MKMDVCGLEQAVLNAIDGPALSSLVLTQLHSLFPQTIVAALDIIDREGVSCVSCPAKRILFHVSGKGGKAYLVLPDENFCECVAFEYQVLRKELSMCKHLLATKIAMQMGDQVFKTNIISNEAFAQQMCSMRT
eukprot:m.12787 g.12787  ORF g.12787 m.12787 type:complete len:134 (-) comp4058_c0_seq1:132-533(-)